MLVDRPLLKQWSPKVILSFLMLVVFQVACSKKAPNEENLQQDGPLTVQLQERDPLSEQAMNDVVNYATEFYGKTLYETIKYHLKTVQPEEFLGPSLSGSFASTFTSIDNANMGKTTEQRLQDVVALGALTPEAAQKIRDFESLVDGYADSSPTFGEVYFALKNFELGIINSTTLNQEDMEPVLGLSSMFRNHLKYQYELNGFTVDDRTEGCLFGRKLSCWGKYFSDTVIDAIKAGVTIFVSEKLGNQDVDWKAIKKAVLSGGIVGGIFNLIKLYRDKSCACDAAAPPNPCAGPKALTVSIDNNCNPLQQTLDVLGQGSAASSYTYSIMFGTFPDYGNITFITTPSPSIVVHQNDPNVPIIVGVVVNYSSCSGNSFPAGPTRFDLPAIVNGTGTVLVSGATHINWGDPTIFTYECLGTWRINPNTIMTDIAPSYHGTLVSSTIGTANVLWNQAKSQPYAPASVSATVKNTCSQQTLSAWLTPISIQ